MRPEMYSLILPLLAGLNSVGGVILKRIRHRGAAASVSALAEGPLGVGGFTWP